MTFSPCDSWRETVASPVLQHHVWRRDGDDAELRRFAATTLRLPSHEVVGKCVVPPPGVSAWFTAGGEALCRLVHTGSAVSRVTELEVVGSAAEVEITVKAQVPPEGLAAGAVCETAALVPRMWHGSRAVRCGPWPWGVTILLCSVTPVPLSVSPPSSRRLPYFGVVPAPGVPSEWTGSADDADAVAYASNLCGISPALVSAPSQAGDPPTLVVWDREGKVLVSFAENKRVVVLVACSPGVLTFTFCCSGRTSAVVVSACVDEPQAHEGFDDDVPTGLAQHVSSVVFVPDRVARGDTTTPYRGVPPSPSAWSLADGATMACEPDRLIALRRRKHARKQTSRTEGRIRVAESFKKPSKSKLCTSGTMLVAHLLAEWTRRSRRHAPVAGGGAAGVMSLGNT